MTFLNSNQVVTSAFNYLNTHKHPSLFDFLVKASSTQNGWLKRVKSPKLSTRNYPNGAIKIIYNFDLHQPYSLDDQPAIKPLSS